MIPGQRLRLFQAGNQPRTSVRYNSWDADSKGEWIYPEGLSYSDYVGSMHTRANYDEFVERFADFQEVEWLPVIGGHGTTGVVIRFDADARVPEIGEFIRVLEEGEYPGEDRVSDLEQEAIEEAWVRYGRQDFQRQMEKMDDRLEDLFIAAEEAGQDEAILDRLRHAAEQNESPTVEDAGGNVSFRIHDEMLKKVNDADEDGLLVAFDMARHEQNYASGKTPLEYLFSELGERWNAKDRMPAFYYALLEFNPKAARTIGVRPNADAFAVELGERLLGDNVHRVDSTITSIARGMGRALSKLSPVQLEVLADVIESEPEDGNFDAAFKMIDLSWKA